MTKNFALVFSASLAIAAGMAVADSHVEGPEPATPVELYTCNFNEGKGYQDLLGVIEDWNAWADGQNLTDYSAWTLMPYYTGPNYGFDVAWLGSAPSAVALGRAQDAWLTTGGDVPGDFAEVFTCEGHSAFAVLNFKEPPERKNPDNVVITFSDCTIAETSSFSKLVPAMMEWGQYREENGSTGGMWAMMPAMGGGGEDFDFKWVTAYQNLADMGADFDQYSESGWRKGNELFEGKVDCDSARVYLATNHRRGEDPDD